MNKLSQVVVFSLGIMVCTATSVSYGANPLNNNTNHLQRQEQGSEVRGERRKDHRQDNRQDRRQRAGAGVATKKVRIKPVPVSHKKVLLVPRKRSVRNVVVIRHHGHAYYGYGHFHHDNDAWKWLAFTAITLKILDNIDEASQRAHEAAQVKATTAEVGEKIDWQTDSASGTVVTTKQGMNNQGQTCREFQQTVTIGGETEQAYGTACLQQDGSWKMV